MCKESRDAIQKEFEISMLVDLSFFLELQIS